MENNSFNVGKIDKLLKRSILICCVLVFSSVAGVKSTVKQCAFIGQPVKFLCKMNTGSHYSDPSLYSETEIRIASWKGNTSTDADIISSYIGKIFMDRKKNLWMLDVERKDNGSYYLKFNIQSDRHEIILIVMEKKQLNVCLNSPPNSTEKYYGNLMEEQVMEKFLNDHPQYVKRDFGNLTGEQIREEYRKWQDDHPEFTNGYSGTLTFEQIGQDIIELLDDYADHIKKYRGTSHGTTTTGNKKDYTEGNWNITIIGLLIAILVILILDIALRNIFSGTYIRDGWVAMKRWIRETHHRDVQPTQSHKEFTGVTIEGSGETIRKPPQPSRRIERLPPESNGTDIENKDDFHPTDQRRIPIHIRDKEGNTKSHDSESNEECIDLPKGACGSKLPINENKDDFHSTDQRRKPIYIRETAGNMKSHDSESKDECIELLTKGASGSTFPVENESEDDFHQMGQDSSDFK
ncbi:hypothetical protein ACJMK2_025720 [Sinanodonta woodiana]|uniref:Uncharacterized protein n=1 Tax=Sinanodonta woodiana TaxID=1069815 RepID=A0ABD3XL53_SINWO